jgi:hypothetical protein
MIVDRIDTMEEDNHAGDDDRSVAMIEYCPTGISMTTQNLDGQIPNSHANERMQGILPNHSGFQQPQQPLNLADGDRMDIDQDGLTGEGIQGDTVSSIPAPVLCPFPTATFYAYFCPKIQEDPPVRRSTRVGTQKQPQEPESDSASESDVIKTKKRKRTQTHNADTTARLEAFLAPTTQSVIQASKSRVSFAGISQDDLMNDVLGPHSLCYHNTTQYTHIHHFPDPPTACIIRPS